MRTRPLATSLLVGLVVAMPTSAAAISGGEKADSEYIVQIATQTNKESTQAGTESKKIDRCTGSALNSEWIITADHCVEDAASQTSSNIYFSNDKEKPGDPISSAEIVRGPSADLALIKLSKPHELSQYATLASDHEVTVGQEGYIYGYGRGSKGEAVSWLRRATVTQRDEGRDAFWNKTYGLVGKDGISNHGDSGGPFIVNNKLVGITVSGPHVANDYWVGEVSNAVLLAPFVEWITKTTGVTAVPFATEIPAPAPDKKEDKADKDTSATPPEGTPGVNPETDPTKQPETDSTTTPDKLTPEIPGVDPGANSAPDTEGSAVDKTDTSTGTTNTGTTNTGIINTGTTNTGTTDTGTTSTNTETKTASTSSGEQGASSEVKGTQAVGTPAVNAAGTGQAAVKEKRQPKLAHTGAFTAPLAAAGILSLGAGALLVLRSSASRREA
ncbi:S1 family peptidase [Trueperella pyogenes]|uniref:S1 family peptidase n=1 Tax=Trueperella pyogenes TaxID=1661 RepID=UPI0016710A07|nr:trypsin-like serine protease [Trueperella pyogenes]